MAVPNVDSVEGFAVARSADLCVADFSGVVWLASPLVSWLTGGLASSAEQTSLVARSDPGDREWLVTHLEQLAHGGGPYTHRHRFHTRNGRVAHTDLLLLGLHTGGRPLCVLAEVQLLPAEEPDAGVALYRGCIALTPRQQDLATLLLEGLAIGAIAQRLGISIHTARMHIRNMHALAKSRTLHALALHLAEHVACCVRGGH